MIDANPRKPAPSASALEISPATYSRVFEGTPDGQLVLQDLCRRYYRDPFVAGGIEGERETLVRVGEARVVSFILKRMAMTPEDGNDVGD